MTFTDQGLAELDGFRVEIDLAHERADVILDRPPFNIISMPQRDQLRPVFEALDQDARVRVIVLRAVGEHFSSGGNIKGFMEASPEHVSKLAWNIAAPARCSKPVIVANRGYTFGVGFEISLACDFRMSQRRASTRSRSRSSAKSPALADLRGCKRSSASRAPRTSSCARSAFRPSRRSIGASRPNACRTKIWKRRPTRWSTSCVHSRPLAQRTAKKLLNDTEDSTLSIAIELEGHCYSRLRQSNDFKEGVEAFHAKRAPKFKGQ